MLPKKLKFILKTIIILILICTVFVLLANILVHNQSVQSYLLKQVGEYIGYEIRAKEIKASFSHGFGFSAHDLAAESLIRPEHFKASKLSVALSVKELIRGRIVPTMIFIYKPHIELSMKKGATSLKISEGPVLNKMLSKGMSGLRYYSVKQGSLYIDGIPFEFQDIEIDAYPEKGTSDIVNVSIRGRVISEKKEAPFTLQGTVASDGEPGNELSSEVVLKSGRFPFTWIPWPASLPFSRGTGKLDMTINAAHGGISAEGKIFTRDLSFSVIKKGISKEYTSDFLEIDIASRYSGKILEILSLNVKGADFSASAKSKFDFNDSEDPHIYFSTETPFLPLNIFKRIFPTPLVTPLIKNEIYPILSAGNARLEHYSMNGTREQYRHLNLPENSDVISMKVEWKDMVVLEDGGALPFEKVEGELTISNGVLSTTVKDAVFGNSTITSASLDINNLYGEQIRRIAVNGQFDLSDLRQQENLYLMPAGARKNLQAFQAVSGKLKGSVQIGFERNWINPWIIKGDLFGKNCQIEHKDLFLPLSLDEVDLQIDAEGENRLRGTWRWGESEFQAFGSTDGQMETCDVQVTSRVHVRQIMDRFQLKDPLHLKFKDLVPFQAALTKEDGVWSCQGKIDLGNVIIDADAVQVDPPGKDDNAVFNVDYLPGEKLHLSNLRCNLGKSAIEMTGSYDLNNRDTAKLKVLIEKLLLKDLGVRFQKKEMLATGIISCNVEVKNFLGNPSKLFVTGRAMGEDISFALASLPSSVCESHFNLDFSGDVTSIRSFNMLVGQSSVGIKGHLQGWTGLKGELNIFADYLDISDFITAETRSVDIKSEPGLFMKNSDVQLSLMAYKGQWKRLTFSPLEAEGSFRAGDLFIKRAEARLEHGVFSLKGHVKGHDGPERISFVSEIQMKEQPVEDFLYSLGIEKEVLDGALIMDAHLSTKGNRRNDLISGLEGNVAFRVEKGSINSPYGLFYKVLNFLSLQSFFNKEKLPDLSKESFPFELLEARFNCKDGIVTTDDFTVKSPIFNVVAPGNVDLVKKNLDVVIWVQTLEAMDSVVGWVPVVGYILTEKEGAPKGVFIYPVEVRGAWHEPEIKYTPSLMRLGSGVYNIFKRILNVPGHYFKKISGGDEKSKKRTSLPGALAQNLNMKWALDIKDK